LYSEPSNTEKQKELSFKIIKTPLPNHKRFEKTFNDYVYALKGPVR